MANIYRVEHEGKKEKGQHIEVIKGAKRGGPTYRGYGRGQKETGQHTVVSAGAKQGLRANM